MSDVPVLTFQLITSTMRYITIAIHTYEKALALRALLESEGIAVVLNNVNLEIPAFSSGVRVRIPEADLPLALRIVENRELFTQPGAEPTNDHKILVPVDLSEKSYNAAVTAVYIASAKKESIQFLYSYLDPYVAGNIQLTDSLNYEVGEQGARQALDENARKLINNFGDRLKSQMKNGSLPVVKFSSHVCEGVPEDAIVNYAKAKRPNLIVMGTRNSSKKESEMIGSVTAEVLDDGRFTVLTVPESFDRDRLLKPTNILFFSNIDQDDILAMDALYRLFGSGEANVTIVHLPVRKRFSQTSAGKALMRLSDYCRDNFTHYHFETVPLPENDYETEFDRLNSRNNFDLLVVPNHRRNAFSRLFNPGLAHKLLLRNDIPILVIPV